MIKAIVYTSNTGTTAQYAAMLAKNTSLEAYALKEAEKSLASGSEIIYMGWLMAGHISGLKRAAGRFEIRAVCSVGTGEGEGQRNDIEKFNPALKSAPLYMLRGGYYPDKIHGIYRLMMKFMMRKIERDIAKKPSRKLAEELDIMKYGGSFVSEENLSGITAWYNDNK